jgi:GT2 family glycosyltransferase
MDSVLALDYDNYEIICVDSGSTDGTVDYIKKEFPNEPGLTVIGIPQNVGNGVLFHEGTMAAKGDLILFLNFDTIVAPNLLDKLASAFENDSKLGAAQPMVLDMAADSDVVQCAGIYMLDYCGWTWSWMKGMPYADFLAKYDGAPFEIGIASGTALAVRRSVYIKVGEVDRSYFMYFEEPDLCWRLWLAGYSVKLVPDTKIYHLGGDMRKYTVGYGIAKARKSYHTQRNHMRMMLKNYGGWNIARFAPTTILVTVALGLYGLFREGDYYSLFAMVRAFGWNMSHMRQTIREREIIQHYRRRVPDKLVLSHISKRLPLSAMINMTETRRRRLGRAPLYSSLHKTY